MERQPQNPESGIILKTFTHGGLMFGLLYLHPYFVYTNSECNFPLLNLR